MWGHGYGSTLVQIMASCLRAPNHYPNQCWPSDEVRWNSFAISLGYQSVKWFENHIFRIIVVSPKVSCRRHQMEKKSASLALCAANSPVTGEFPAHKCQWRGALMFYLICAWINGWINNREAGDLRRHRTDYDVTVMHDISMGLLSSRYIKMAINISIRNFKQFSQCDTLY